MGDKPTPVALSEEIAYPIYSCIKLLLYIGESSDCVIFFYEFSVQFVIAVK